MDKSITDYYVFYKFIVESLVSMGNQMVTSEIRK